MHSRTLHLVRRLLRIYREIIATTEYYLLTTSIAKPEGDEIFLDYGDEWVEAWESHVAAWRPPVHNEKYRSAEQFRKILEQDPTQYSSFVAQFDVFCRDSFAKGSGGSESLVYQHNPNAMIIPCQIIGANPLADAPFTVRFILESTGAPHDQDNIPLEGLQFFNKMYTSDMHLRNAFRHEIGLPDDLFPRSWIDLHKCQYCQTPPSTLSLDELMNRNVEWVRIPVELEFLPYSPGIDTVCFLPNEIFEFQGADSMEWKFNRNEIPRALPCKITGRDHEGSYTEVMGRADSSRPLFILYNVTVALPNNGGYLNVTGLPRSAIEFNQTSVPGTS